MLRVSEEKQQINTNRTVFGSNWPGLEPMIYIIRGEYANYCATDTVK